MADDESGHQYDACDYLACISGNYGAFSSLMVMFVVMRMAMVVRVVVIMSMIMTMIVTMIMI